MPTLTPLSLYNARKSMYAARLSRARSELERFKEDLVLRFGKETAAVGDTPRTTWQWRGCRLWRRGERRPSVSFYGWSARRELELDAEQVPGTRGF